MIAATATRHEDLWRSFGVCQLLPQAHDFMTVLVLQLFEPVTITLSLRQLPLEGRPPPHAAGTALVSRAVAFHAPLSP